MPIMGPPAITPIEPDVFDDDDEGWQDMPVVQEADEFTVGLDEEDQKKYHYMPPTKKDISAGGIGNATGNVMEIDFEGSEWRSKVDQNESDYTRLRMVEEDDSDEVVLRTKYLFDEDKAMTPLSQMQATKDMLTEAQRIAYVGLCALTSREMAARLKAVNHKEVKKAMHSMELWALKIMGRLYYHMELATEEQKMIESLAIHGIDAKDLVPSLMTTHTVANPEYDPAEAQKQEDVRIAESLSHPKGLEDESIDIAETEQPPPYSPNPDPSVSSSPTQTKPIQTTAKILEETAAASIPGVSTRLSAADKNVTLDVRWTILCDLFLILIADSVYDARSRVLLENVALKLGLGWLDVVKFERRVTEALEIQEDVENLEQKEIMDGVQKNSKKRRYLMLGLATIGGGLVIGLSAGLLAPVIGAGLGAAFTTIGITGTTGFLAGTGGAAVITTGGVLTGSGIAARGMAKRTQAVRTFDLLPLHNNKRVNCILTVSGFMTGPQDDVRLPFSVLDPVVGDVFSVLWEPDMIRETGSALKILTSEVLTQLAQTALSATVMTALMSALQWPIILTKLGYLIDNPWSNALDRARAAGSVLADVLIHRHLGVRPITLIGFSLGARVIFYALLELAKQKAFGIVQDVIILGTTVTAPVRTWLEARSAVSGRFVNGYARNDWVLNYLFQCSWLGECRRYRQDLRDMSYRTFMPLILDQLGFPVSSDFFDEPVEPDFEEDRIVVREGEDIKKKSWFGRKKKSFPSSAPISRPPSASSKHKRSTGVTTVVDDEMPPREDASTPVPAATPRTASPNPELPPTLNEDSDLSTAEIPAHAGFDFAAIKEVIGNDDHYPGDVQIHNPKHFPAPPIPPPSLRPESAPPPLPESPSSSSKSQSSFDTRHEDEPIAGPSSRSRTDLSSAILRSISLNNIRGEAEDDVTPPHARPSTPSEFRPPPTLSFGGSSGSIWSSEQPDPTLTNRAFGGYQVPSSFGAPRPTGMLSFDTNADPLGSSVYGSYALRTPTDDPFAASTASLSFGGADGSITFAPSPPSSSSRVDPWDIGAHSFGSDKVKKSPSALDLNPWQS
ncbi:hypothetical protein A0H81_01335 [Grifola frondosa]|uniref:Membrane protein C6F6.13c n=1 Tax=Grifola frondosa TaxID=5627 RepID=A0A1C7MPU5_GRIFR|nr:hypothetical protein A0H81_01335 [Grifola frondosa]